MLNRSKQEEMKSTAAIEKSFMIEKMFTKNIIMKYLCVPWEIGNRFILATKQIQCDHCFSSKQTFLQAIKQRTNIPFVYGAIIIIIIVN